MNSHSLYFWRVLYTMMLALSLLLATPAIPAPTTVGCPENPDDVPAAVPPSGVSIESEGVKPVTPVCPVDPGWPFAVAGAVNTESTTTPATVMWIRRHSSDPVMGSFQRLRRKRIWLVFSRSSRRAG